MTPPPHAEPLVVLGMYPFPALRGAWSELFEAVATRVRRDGVDVPAVAVRWDRDPHDTWLDPQLVLGMTCGWPLVTTLRDRVRVVGTFTTRLEPAPQPHLYRSVVITREDLGTGDLAARTAAINAADSLSGNISLLHAHGLNAEWNGSVITTGAHVASIEAVRDGAADVASIDGLTWAYRQRDAPETVEGVVVVGHGPWVPGLPVILPRGTPDGFVQVWRDAFVAALADPAMAGTRDRLLLEGFVALDLADYDAALASLRRQHG